MKNEVFCFFSRLDDQKALSGDSFKIIDLWKSSWEKQGWNPIVLGVDDAVRHPRYKDAVLGNFDTNLYRYAVNSPTYLMACYQRWFAYTQINLTRVFWADYDVINYGLTPEAANRLPHAYAKFCPESAAGYFNKQGADDLISIFFDVLAMDEGDIRQTIPMMDLYDKRLSVKERTDKQCYVSDMTLLDQFLNWPLATANEQILCASVRPDGNYKNSILVHYDNGMWGTISAKSFYLKEASRAEAIPLIRKLDITNMETE